MRSECRASLCVIRQSDRSLSVSGPIGSRETTLACCSLHSKLAWPKPRALPTIPLWDGRAAQRIVQVLQATLADPLQPRLTG